MDRKILGLSAVVALLGADLAYATIFGNLRGIVHDPQHRPISRACVTLRAHGSEWFATAESNADGEFQFNAVPIGEYTITVTAAGFAPRSQEIEVVAESAPVLHFLLSLAGVSETVQVSAAPENLSLPTSPSVTLVNRQQIAHTPGADRTNSLAMITDFVPGAYVVHDQLHIRGGHQVSWLIDGVPVPNTNIASNVGPQFDPKDVDYIEIQRGGYSAQYGDRTFGVFNVVTRSGFERQDEGELVASYGSFDETNDQLNFGSHTERFAYYASFNGNRTDLGLATPTPRVLHDQASGLGGFASLILNATSRDQLRMVTSLRKDHYQVPNTPEQEVTGIRDLDLEGDAFINFSWVRSFNPGLLLTVSPFYHFNRADYAGGPNDTPVVPTDNRASTYTGFESTILAVEGKHTGNAGVEAFAQHDHTLFGVAAPLTTGLGLRQQEMVEGNEEAVFAQDQYQPWSWLTLSGGVRLSRFSGLIADRSADPRLAVAVRVPKLNWTLSGFYGRYYQPPPLDAVSGPLLQLAVQQGFGFLPLHGEKDEQHQFGAAIPFRAWTLDVDAFMTRARNYFDHDVLGNSNIFLPLTIQEARIHGWEAMVRSPRLFGRAQLYVAYSRQYAQGRGGITGGLTDFSPPPESYFFLDHDQRTTLTAVLSLALPRHAWVTTAAAYGSGFLNGNGPDHLPAHTTVDIAMGKSLSDNWSVALTALNAANRRFLLDNSNTFGGTHYADPRRLLLELRYRFHY